MNYKTKIYMKSFLAVTTVSLFAISIIICMQKNKDGLLEGTECGSSTEELIEETSTEDVYKSEEIESTLIEEETSSPETDTLTQTEEPSEEIETESFSTEHSSDVISSFIHIEETEHVTVPEEQNPGRYNHLSISLTEEEEHVLSVLVFLEAGGSSLECQKAVASVVLNRMVIYGASLHDVIHAPGQFSPKYLISSTQPTESTKLAVEDVLQNGINIPPFVTYFRSKYYHSWGDLTNYAQIDSTYFSYSLKHEAMFR